MTSTIQSHLSKTLTSYERELSPLEQAMEVLNRRASSPNVITICRITGPLSEQIIRQALDLIQCRHPRLNSRIVGSLDSIRFEGGGMQIPLRFDKSIYRQRNQVERCFNRLKQCRRIATRYEKKAENYLAMVALASIMMWL